MTHNTAKPGEPVWDSRNQDWPEGKEVLQAGNEFVESEQDNLDWNVFSELHMKERGVWPQPRDRAHREFFHWFTRGSHAEFMGKLTRKTTPTTQGEGR